MKRGLGFWTLWVLALTGLGSGCAMPPKKRDGLVLGAMVGAIVGGGAGAGIASNGDRDDYGPGIAIGAAEKRVEKSFDRDTNLQLVENYNNSLVGSRS